MTLPTTLGARDLDHYDPQRALQLMAVAESAENYYRRAKDATKLYEAIEAKLTEQRKFIRWWDRQKKNKGGRPSTDETTYSTVSGFVSIAALFGLDPADERGINNIEVMLWRWRKALWEEIDFLQALEDARHRALRICEQEKIGTVRGTEGTGEFELYTPAFYIEAAREVLGEIDLDPASNYIAQATVRARAWPSACC